MVNTKITKQKKNISIISKKKRDFFHGALNNSLQFLAQNFKITTKENAITHWIFSVHKKKRDKKKNIEIGNNFKLSQII